MYVNSIKSVSNNIQFRGSKIPKAKNLKYALPPNLSKKLQQALDKVFAERELMIDARRARLAEAAEKMLT